MMGTAEWFSAKFARCSADALQKLETWLRWSKKGSSRKDGKDGERIGK